MYSFFSNLKKCRDNNELFPKIEVIIAIIIIIICVIGAINSPERHGLFGRYKDNDEWIGGIIFTVIGFAGIITITIKKFCLKEKINFDFNKLMQK